MSSHAHIARQALTGLLATGAACGLGGCSVFSISPAMELLKATGTAASFAVGHAVGSSVDVVRKRSTVNLILPQDSRNGREDIVVHSSCLSFSGLLLLTLPR